jgi:hypothetical protein
MGIDRNTNTTTLYDKKKINVHKGAKIIKEI